VWEAKQGGGTSRSYAFILLVCEEWFRTGEKFEKRPDLQAKNKLDPINLESCPCKGGEGVAYKAGEH